MTNCWSNEKIIEFINEVRVWPELWDAGLAKYKDRRLKSYRWRKVGEKFKCSSVEAYKKYRCLRTYAKNEEKKKRNRADDKQVKWFAYDAMSFVLQDTPNLEVRSESTLDVTETRDHDIDSDNEGTLEIDMTDPLLPPVQPESCSVSRKKSKIVDPDKEKVQNIPEVVVNKRNEYSGLAQHIVYKLKKYDTYTRAQAEFKIMKVLFECDMGMHGDPKDTQSPGNESRAGTSQCE